MASGGDEERSGFGKFAKSQARYGTTTRSSYTNESYIKHAIRKNDTLAGIALNYGVTMEQIKRANNIWTNDSLFLREFLLIPISTNSMQMDLRPVVSNGDIMAVSGAQNDSFRSQEIITKQDIQTAHKLARSKSASSPASGSSAKELSDSAECKSGDLTAHDFLTKLDSSLAQIKTKVQELEHTSEFPEDATNPLSMLPFGKRASRLAHRHKLWSRDPDLVDPLSEPRLVFSNETNRQVRTSLEKLEHAQNEIFQL